MKYYEEYMIQRGLNVIDYIEFNQPNPYKEFDIFDPVDRITIKQQHHIYPSPAFLVQNYEAYDPKSYQFRPFYNFIKRELNLLTNVESQDSKNRRKIPKHTTFPDTKVSNPKNMVKEAIAYTEKHFPNNYGTTTTPINVPITHRTTKKMLRSFLKSKFQNFGAYQDAIVLDESYLFHSNLSSSLNIGLLTASDVIEAVRKYGTNVPINSYEGMVRQMIWREYQRFCYTKHPTLNASKPPKPYFESNKRMGRSWYEGTLGIEPVDRCIKKGFETAYLHHIERLMIIGNHMVAAGIKPTSGFRWFMEFSIDSYEWVMTQNVLDMVFFVTGGTTTKRPYVTSSSYVVRMSSSLEPENDWVDRWDDAYKEFMNRNAVRLYRFRAFYPMLHKRAPKRNKHNQLLFPNHPTFTPNLTPYEILSQGAFGGTYWRPILCLRSGKWLKNLHHKYRWKGLDESRLSRDWESYDVSINKFNQFVGSTYEEWYDAGWITSWNEYGWFHWYCDFYYGRRCEDDERQIKRWKGVDSRFGNRLRRIKHSPKIAQTLHHWGIEIEKK